MISWVFTSRKTIILNWLMKTWCWCLLWKITSRLIGMLWLWKISWKQENYQVTSFHMLCWFYIDWPNQDVIKEVSDFTRLVHEITMNPWSILRVKENWARDMLGGWSFLNNSNMPSSRRKVCPMSLLMHFQEGSKKWHISYRKNYNTINIPK